MDWGEGLEAQTTVGGQDLSLGMNDVSIVGETGKEGLTPGKTTGHDSMVSSSRDLKDERGHCREKVIRNKVETPSWECVEFEARRVGTRDLLLCSFKKEAVDTYRGGSHRNRHPCLPPPPCIPFSFVPLLFPPFWAYFPSSPLLHLSSTLLPVFTVSLPFSTFIFLHFFLIPFFFHKSTFFP